MPALEAHMENRAYLLGDKLTIADHFAFAYMEMAEMADLPMDSYPEVSRWFQAINQRESIRQAKHKLLR